MRALSILLLSGVVAACGDVAGPTADDTFELPPADLSLDPARLSVGGYIATPCAFGMFGDGLVQLRERHEWALVDVFFGRRETVTPRDYPNEEEQALVAAHGGRVLHRFNVPAVRARMVLSRIPAMVQEGFWVSVRDVPDATRYDIPVIVTFNQPVTDDDIAVFNSLGGRVERRFTVTPGISGVLPDRSIPVLRQRDDVRRVEVNGIACIG